MKLRAPAYPLITVDPYFSVWSKDRAPNAVPTTHWTGQPNSIIGTVDVDGERYHFLGYHRSAKKLRTVSVDVDALSTSYVLENEKIRIRMRFTTPLLLDDLDVLTRPVSYMTVSYEKLCPTSGEVEITVAVSKELCLDTISGHEVTLEQAAAGELPLWKMGNVEQNPLNRAGDDLRIDWGYLYFGAVGGRYGDNKPQDKIKTMPSMTVTPEEGEEALFIFAYDDIKSIDYFGKQLPSYWNRNGKDILTAISEAVAEKDELFRRCDEFSEKLYLESLAAGGEKYAEILALAYRQTIAAHKVAVDECGDILFISKECFSNGCAATVDVSYPSTPLFLIYNTELIKGMLRPVYKYNATEEWTYDFAPHDAGRYPLVTAQRYGRATYQDISTPLLYEKQMPVEECGNMIIMEANVAIAEKCADFAMSHIDVLEGWCKYLIKYGDDPENQLCTDDFAGHLAHNCNLSLKAIMGIMGLSIIYSIAGDEKKAAKYKRIARKKAKSWCERAKNTADNSYRLTFDKDGSYSMKYNMVWDKIWGTKLFPDTVYRNETESYLDRMNKYGLPLDSRCDQTKSDWLVWCATLSKNEKTFAKLIAPLWSFYNETPTRVPMTDWYDSLSGHQVGWYDRHSERSFGFTNRTVQGGLYIKLLDKSGKLKI